MKFTKLMIGALALLLLLPLRVAAESIEVTPAEEDYGDLAVGSEPRTQVFDLMSMGPTALTVFLVEITDDTEGAYSITEANGLNESLP